MQLLRRNLRSSWPLVSLAVPLLLLVSLVGSASPDLKEAATTAVINLVLVVGLYIFVGNSGILSFGHISFMAVGAYACALLTIPVATKTLMLEDVPGFLKAAELSTAAAIPVAGGVAALVALVLGGPLMRLSGIAASIATLSLLIISKVFLDNYKPLTGGSTMTGVPIDTDLGSAMTWALVALLIAFVFQQSRFGLRLRASREDEAAAQSLGVGVGGERLVAFVLSAFVMGVGGALYAHLLGSFSPDAFYLQLTFLTIAMLVIGGVNSLAGAVVGTVLISALAEIFAKLEAGDPVGPLTFSLPAGAREMTVAALMLVILVLRPDGLTGGREIPWPGRRRAPKLATSAASSLATETKES
jgi:branched-chain amino acid transport system permease protein